MTYFSEIDWDKHPGGVVEAVHKSSLAAEAGIFPGDAILAINGHKLQDVIDVSYYGAEELLEILVRRDSEYLIFETERSYGQELGIDFAHPTFDVDIHRCNNLCEFCFVLQMAPRFRRTLYIKDDDYRYSFLFGHFVTLTNLTEHDWWRIETMRLSPLYVSVHVTDTAMRQKFLRNKKAPDILEQIQWLGSKGIEIHTQIVVVPEFNDGYWFDQSIEDLARLWPTVQSVSIVPVGLTRFHKYGMRTHTKDEASSVLRLLERKRSEFRKHLGINFIYPTDEWYLVAGVPVPPKSSYDGQQLQENGLGNVRDFLDEWTKLQKEINRKRSVGMQDFGQRYTHLTLVTGKLFAGTLAGVAAQFEKLIDIKASVESVNNHALGSTITVAGLLNGSDIIAHLENSGFGDLVVLPYRTFDHPKRISLDDVSPQQIADRLVVPVALAETMGDVWDALSGTSTLIFQPKLG